MEFRSALDEIFKDNLAKGAKAEASVVRGRSFKAQNILNEDYDSFWAAPDDVTEATIAIDLGGKKTFNLIQLQEYIPLGQRIKSFTVEAMNGDG